MVKVLLVNNDGGGFADHVELDDGTTVGDLFSRHTGGRDPSDYKIRVQRQTVPADYVLKTGDRVTFTPTKIEGA